MTVVVAIHGENGFARGWPGAAERLGVGVKRVNGYSNAIWADLAGCGALLWNVDHEHPVDLAFGRSVLLSAEHRGLSVYPNHRTVWHFDDKVAQKYLLEAVGAPLATTSVFFDKQEARRFLDTADFPLVFKLRGGAGSLNVRLVRNRTEGRRIVDMMFGPGLRPFPVIESVWRAAVRAKRPAGGMASMWRRGRRSLEILAKKLSGFQRERGYVLFQRFVPGNEHDVRLTVIGGRAFTFIRGVRANDFRASGSGVIQYPGPDGVPHDMVELAFRTSRALGAQSLALDFVREPGSGSPVLLEVSYSFMASAVEACPGYFSPEFEWVPGRFSVPELIMRDVLATVGR